MLNVSKKFTCELFGIYKVLTSQIIMVTRLSVSFTTWLTLSIEINSHPTEGKLTGRKSGWLALTPFSGDLCSNNGGSNTCCTLF